jgi:D-proline reductase (dithiol) PrdB
MSLTGGKTDNMAELKELSLTLRAFMKAYPWRRIDPIPWTPPLKPLAQSRVALVSTAGMVMPDQEAFDDNVKGGDSTFRVIPRDADVHALIETHRSESFDHAGIQRDQNLGFPLERMRELEAGGIIGELAPRHLSFMGSITAPGRLMRDTAPAAARILVEDQVDVALLVPV